MILQRENVKKKLFFSIFCVVCVTDCFHRGDFCRDPRWSADGDKYGDHSKDDGTGYDQRVKGDMYRFQANGRAFHDKRHKPFSDEKACQDAEGDPYGG